MLPILHLNGYKIANRTVLARLAPGELASLLRGYGWEPYEAASDNPDDLHQQLAGTLDTRVRLNCRHSGRSSRTGRRGRQPALLALYRPAHPEGMRRTCLDAQHPEHLAMRFAPTT